MKRKYREAMRAALRQQDAYIDGLTEDDALDILDSREEYEAMYQPSTTDHHLDEQVPF